MANWIGSDVRLVFWWKTFRLYAATLAEDLGSDLARVDWEAWRAFNVVEIRVRVSKGPRGGKFPSKFPEVRWYRGGTATVLVTYQHSKLDFGL